MLQLHLSDRYAWQFGDLAHLFSFHFRENIYQVAEKTKKDVGPVTILVNNAGIVSGTSLLETPDSKIVKTFEVNVLAHFWTIKVRKESLHFSNVFTSGFST